MKREILFRGKDKATDQWVYGDYTHNEGLNTHYISRNVNNISRKVWEVDPDIVEQYMGKKDKNGKKIFEGDIVHIKGDGFDGKEVGVDYHRVVTFNDGMICLSVGDVFHMPINYYVHGLDDWDVVGNITDTPELMK
jgi:hypothetical protein